MLGVRPRFTLVALFLAGAVLLSPVMAVATPPAARIQWITSGGQLVDFNWSYRAKWRWKRLVQTEAFERPVQEIEIEIPKGVVIEKVEAGTTPAFYQKARSQLLVYATRSVTVSLQVKGAHGKPPAEANFFVELSNPDQHVWLHPSCEDEGIFLRPGEGSAATSVYIGAACKKAGNTILLTPFWSADLQLQSTTLRKEGVTTAFRLQVPTGANGPISFGKLTFIQNASELKNGIKTPSRSFHYTVGWRPPRPFRNFSGSVSVGPSYLNFTEDPTGVSLKELVMTGKLQANYWLVPRRWDASVSAFGTVAALQSEVVPAAISPAKFYGLNLRLGREFNGLKLSGGWYFWGMTMKGPGYGMAMVSGPQLLLSYRGISGPSGRSWSAYSKVAMVADGLALSLKSRELAAGAGYELSSPMAAHPVYLTADFAHADLPLSTIGLHLKLMSLSAALSYGF